MSLILISRRSACPGEFSHKPPQLCDVLRSKLLCIRCFRVNPFDDEQVRPALVKKQLIESSTQFQQNSISLGYARFVDSAVGSDAVSCFVYLQTALGVAISIDTCTKDSFLFCWSLRHTRLSMYCITHG